MKQLGMVLLALVISASHLSAQEYAVVSFSPLPSLKRFQVKAIFLKKMTYLDGVHLIAVNLPPDHNARKSFEKSCLQMGRSRLREYWTKAHYLGHRPPLRKDSLESVQRFLNTVEGTVSYLPIEEVAQSMNILYRWSD